MKMRRIKLLSIAVYMNINLFETNAFLPVPKFLSFIVSPALKLSCDFFSKNFRPCDIFVRKINSFLVMLFKEAACEKFCARRP